MQVQEEASQRRLSIRPANLRVTHVTGGTISQLPEGATTVLFKIPRCTDTLVKARDFFFSVAHNDRTYSKHSGHVHTT